jgi:parallel beta-helix repeat protein
MSLRVQKVEASGTIYIRADGSIDPPDAPVSTVNNVTYTLTGNITSDADGIVVERSNIIIGGNGYTLQGSGSGNGFTLSSVSNVTIKDMKIKAFILGILLDGSSNNNITRNNIANNSYGISLYEASNNTVLCNSVTDNFRGIWLSYATHNLLYENNITNNEDIGVNLWFSSDNNILHGNMVLDNGDGIFLSDSSNNTLSENSMTNNSRNFLVDGMLSNLIHNIDISNTVDDKPIYYLVDRHEMVVPRIAGYVALINCRNMTVEGLQLRNNNEGIILANTNSSLITNNTIENCPWSIKLSDYSNDNIVSENAISKATYGITCLGSSGNTVSHNKVENVNQYGIWIGGALNVSVLYNNITSEHWSVRLDNSNWITVSGNNIVNSHYGLELFRSLNNRIIANDIESNDYGILVEEDSHYNIISGNNVAWNNRSVCLYGVSNNTIYGNNIANNSYGIWLETNFEFNVVYHNNFVNNTDQVYSYYTWNLWDNGMEGNYWSNYIGDDLDYDGIGDTAYEIDADNQDNYPLMGMFSSFNTSYGYAVDFVSNSSISNFSFNLSSMEVYPPEAILAFNVSGEAGTEGFLRVCIPTALINGSYVVKFNGEAITNTTYPQVRELPCSSETYEYLYINYTHSEHTIEISGTTIIPEFPSLLILPIFMIAILLAVIAYRRKHARWLYGTLF